MCIIGFYIFVLAFDLFDRYPPLDIPTHLVGGMATTYFYRSAIRNSQTLLGDIPKPIQVLFAFTATGTIAILWEFYENALDYILGTHKVRGLHDTIVDLFLGLLGALVFSLFYKRR